MGSALVRINADQHWLIEAAKSAVIVFHLAMKVACPRQDISSRAKFFSFPAQLFSGYVFSVKAWTM